MIQATAECMTLSLAEKLQNKVDNEPNVIFNWKKMTHKDSKLGFIGIGLGAVALLLALVHFWAGPFSPQPSLEETVAEKAVAIKKATIAAHKGKEIELTKQESTWDIDRVIYIATSLLGGLAVIFGVVGFANKESWRVAAGASILGGLAIAFQFAAYALGIIVIAILVAAVLSQIGIG